MRRRSVLSLRDRTNVTEFVHTFTGTDRLIVNFLRVKVLADHPEDVRRFLRRTAILPRLRGGLWDQVTGEVTDITSQDRTEQLSGRQRDVCNSWPRNCPSRRTDTGGRILETGTR